METLEVGRGLVALCKEGKFMEAIETYYSDDIVSIEGAEMEGLPKRMEGIEAIKGKNNWWAENHEVHEVRVEGPFAAEALDQFAVYFHMDVTNKPSGQRSQSSEMGLYTITGEAYLLQSVDIAPS